MGGEPLVRPAFMHKFVSYAARRGFYVGVPTNGRLLTPDVTDRLGGGGVATIDVAVDCVREKPGLPKALEHIVANFDHLVRRQRHYGYTVLVNTNITRLNLEDVRLLTEIGRDKGIALAYHLCEMPRGGPPAFQPDDISRVEELLDFLIDGHRRRYAMVNSIDHLRALKALLRGGLEPWPCRAGMNMVVIRTNGTLAPCYPLLKSGDDWGSIACQKLDTGSLAARKQSCSRSCFSTVGYTLAHYYDAGHVLREMLAQASRELRSFR
jgi:MoaA/NifB/PqqE/SkfB family radical SAM enzyme